MQNNIPILCTFSNHSTEIDLVGCFSSVMIAPWTLPSERIISTCIPTMSLSIWVIYTSLFFEVVIL